MSIESAFFSRLNAAIGEQKDKSIELVLTGRCTDHSEYRYSCGYYKGLIDALKIADDILSDLQKG